MSKEKRPRKLTRSQKMCLSAHRLNWHDWNFIEETEFSYRFQHNRTGIKKRVDKFMQTKIGW